LKLVSRLFITRTHVPRRTHGRSRTWNKHAASRSHSWVH